MSKKSDFQFEKISKGDGHAVEVDCGFQINAVFGTEYFYSIQCGQGDCVQIVSMRSMFYGQLNLGIGWLNDVLYLEKIRVGFVDHYRLTAVPEQLSNAGVVVFVHCDQQIQRIDSTVASVQSRLLPGKDVATAYVYWHTAVSW
ncbi:hypothetical protein T4B_12206 [Trichinella pseudospiralis]|uniref:Uncharacterized protein n=1 Tax=Trichinella pseudospiralis TaxID=6337 RepID=A0A0V1IYC2_TRIPS|nr:hypothetical protein T4B_12206 [Trichinella pseudospiralis]